MLNFLRKLWSYMWTSIIFGKGGGEGWNQDPSLGVSMDFFKQHIALKSFNNKLLWRLIFFLSSFLPSRELLEVNHIKTIYNIFVALLIVLIINTVVYDYIDKGRCVTYMYICIIKLFRTVITCSIFVLVLNLSIFILDLNNFKRFLNTNWNSFC